MRSSPFVCHNLTQAYLSAYHQKPSGYTSLRLADLQVSLAVPRLALAARILRRSCPTGLNQPSPPGQHMSTHGAWVSISSVVAFPPASASSGPASADGNNSPRLSSRPPSDHSNQDFLVVATQSAHPLAVDSLRSTTRPGPLWSTSLQVPLLYLGIRFPPGACKLSNLSLHSSWTFWTLPLPTRCTLTRSNLTPSPAGQPSHPSLCLAATAQRRRP